VIALGSNRGDRALHLRRALHLLGDVVRLVRVSAIHETDPVDAPPGSPPFLNMAVAGWTTIPPHELLRALLAIESRLGRVRRERNGPRTIDLDLILYGAYRIRTNDLTLPHPRFREREFVLEPMRELGLTWATFAT
jgi:2-amino-4-hydroxy-6-hydroxymethyldihydropteridine diphosphokinase